jgi:hypothetical protein
MRRSGPTHRSPLWKRFVVDQRDRRSGKIIPRASTASKSGLPASSLHDSGNSVAMSQRLTTAELSAALSLSPTDEREKGALMPGRGRSYEEHRWYYHPSVPDCLDFETKLRHLLEELPAASSGQPGKANVRGCSNDWGQSFYSIGQPGL